MIESNDPLHWMCSRGTRSRWRVSASCSMSARECWSERPSAGTGTGRRRSRTERSRSSERAVSSISPSTRAFLNERRISPSTGATGLDPATSGVTGRATENTQGDATHVDATQTRMAVHSRSPNRVGMARTTPLGVENGLVPEAPRRAACGGLAGRVPNRVSSRRHVRARPRPAELGERDALVKHRFATSSRGIRTLELSRPPASPPPTVPRAGA